MLFLQSFETGRSLATPGSPVLLHREFLLQNNAAAIYSCVKLGSLILLSIALNLAIQWRSPHRLNFTSEATRVSEAIQDGRGFSDPYLTGPSGPTAQMPPLYPYLHAAISTVFGIGVLGWFAIVIITSAAWGLQWYFAYRLAGIFGQGTAGFYGAIFGSLLPLPGRLFKWEAVFTGLAIALASFLLAKILTGDTRWRTVIALGLALACGILLAPVLIALLPLWSLLILVYGYSRKTFPALRIVAAVMILALLPAALWTARNYAVFGHLIPVRDAGLAVAASWDDCAAAQVATNIASGCFAREHPSGSMAMLQRVRSEGEYNLSASEMARARLWITRHPIRAAELTFQHFFFFWFPVDPDGRLLGAVISLVTLLSLLGLFWYRSIGFWITSTALFAYSLTYYFVQVEQRYRLPILWGSVLLACIGLRIFAQWLSPERDRTNSMAGSDLAVQTLHPER